MSRKQTRKSISVSGLAYLALKEHCDDHKLSMSGIAESLLRKFLKLPERGNDVQGEGLRNFLSKKSDKVSTNRPVAQVFASSKASKPLNVIDNKVKKTEPIKVQPIVSGSRSAGKGVVKSPRVRDYDKENASRRAKRSDSAAGGRKDALRKIADDRIAAQLAVSKANLAKARERELASRPVFSAPKPVAIIKPVAPVAVEIPKPKLSGFTFISRQDRDAYRNRAAEATARIAKDIELVAEQLAEKVVLPAKQYEGMPPAHIESALPKIVYKQSEPVIAPEGDKASKIFTF
jgi:hypothetical protein